MKSLNLQNTFEEAGEYINIHFLRHASEEPRLVRAWMPEDDFFVRFGKRLNRNFESLNPKLSELKGTKDDVLILEHGKVFVMNKYRFRGYFCPATPARLAELQ